MEYGWMGVDMIFLDVFHEIAVRKYALDISSGKKGPEICEQESTPHIFSSALSQTLKDKWGRLS